MKLDRLRFVFSSLTVSSVLMDGETELRADSLEHSLSQRLASGPVVNTLAAQGLRGKAKGSPWEPFRFHAGGFRKGKARGT